jgi:hypothetical protein
LSARYQRFLGPKLAGLNPQADSFSPVLITPVLLGKPVKT